MKIHTEQTYIQRLLKSLGDDGSYYAAHWSTDTNIYKVLQTYAGELASGSSETVQTYDDLFIDDCRSALLYNNFGVYLGPARVFEQAVDTDEYSLASGSWVGYRKQNKLLWEAAVAGASFASLYKVGHAMLGVAPKIAPYRDTTRWKLSKVSGSVSSFTSAGFTDASKSWEDSLWAEGLAIIGSGSSRQILRIKGNTFDTVEWYTAPSSISVGDDYILTFSKLGTTTKIYSRAMKAKGALVTAWPQPTADGTRVAQFKTTFNKLRPAGTVPRWASGSTYVAETTYAQFSSWTSGSAVFAAQADGSIVNTLATAIR